MHFYGAARSAPAPRLTVTLSASDPDVSGGKYCRRNVSCLQTAPRHTRACVYATTIHGCAATRNFRERRSLTADEGAATTKRTACYDLSSHGFHACDTRARVTRWRTRVLERRAPGPPGARSNNAFARTRVRASARNNCRRADLTACFCTAPVCIHRRPGGGEKKNRLHCARRRSLFRVR